MTSEPIPRLATAKLCPQGCLHFAPGAGSLWARYAAPVSRRNGETDDGWRRQVRVLRMEYQDIVELRRGAHRGAKLTLEQQRSKEMRDKTGKEVVAHFERWARHPEVRDWFNQDWIGPEERARRIREIFGLPPASPAEAAPPRPGQTKSNPVKAGQTEFNQLNPLGSESSATLGWQWAGEGGRLTPPVGTRARARRGCRPGCARTPCGRSGAWPC
jgi:hypothetical protein